jgi:hypothetical protein
MASTARVDRVQPMTQQDIGARARAERLETIREELVQRVRPLCAAMPDDLFLEMIETMAALQLKYELQGHSARS